MSRVLLVCPEPLGHGQPAGVGIRFLEMARVLRGDGHPVTILSPDDGMIDGQTIRAATADCDVAIVQGHIANLFFIAAHPVPTVIDLYDPYIIENLHYYGERGPEVFTHDHATLTNSLLRGDFFLCASEAQRMFYLGALLAVGRVHPINFESSPHFDSLLAIAPFGVQPPRALAPRNLERPSVLFGGIYDWYDPILAIDAIAIARKSLPDITLTFMTHPNPDLTPQGKLGEAVEHVKRSGYGEFVRFEPWVAYDERAAFFERFTLALLTFPPSIETDLAMRTRIYDYLWCGLPIVTSPAPGTDEILERYGAGVIPSVSRGTCAGGGTRHMPAAPAHTGPSTSLGMTLVSLLRDPDRYERMRRGSQDFVRDHQWERTLQPLRELCRAPRIDATKETFSARPAVVEQPRSFLSRIRRRLAR